jgi:hypothetical protein
VTTATFSVAVESQIERGIMASVDVTKTASSPHFNESAATEMGTKTKRMSGIRFLIAIAFCNI